MDTQEYIKNTKNITVDVLGTENKIKIPRINTSNLKDFNIVNNISGKDLFHTAYGNKSFLFNIIVKPSKRKDHVDIRFILYDIYDDNIVSEVTQFIKADSAEKEIESMARTVLKDCLLSIIDSK